MYKAYSVDSGVMCGVMEPIKGKFKAWVSQPCGALAFGEFMCACLTMEDAEEIARAMNFAKFSVLT